MEKLNLRFIATVITVLLFFISNIAVMSGLELSFDEAYYWIYSQNLSFGYFDHPPMVGLSIKLGTLLFGNTEFGVRFFSQIYLIGTLGLVWTMLKDKIHFIQFSCLIISMPLISLSGLVALPDTPLMFFSALYLFYIRKYLDDDSMKNVLILALTITAMFYSKYHGLLIVLLTVCGYPKFLKRKSFWLIAALVVVFYLPHMYWQYKHDFVSFRFHLFGRAEKHFSLNNIGDYLGGQFVLMGFGVFALALYTFIKNKFSTSFEKILIANSLGFLGFLFILSFRNQIEANWTISCAIALIILLGQYVVEYRKLFIVSVIINLVLFLGLRFVTHSPGSFISPSHETRLNEIYGWDKRIELIKEHCGDSRIVGDNYQISSKLAFYLNDPTIPSLHFGSRESHYSILNFEKLYKKDENICYLTSKASMSSIIVATGYKDPVAIIPNTTLEEITKLYGTTYEEIIRK